MVHQTSKRQAIQSLARHVLGTGLRIDVERVNHGLSTDVYRLTCGQDTFYARVLPEVGASFGPEAYVHQRLRAQGVRVPEVMHYEDFHEPLQRSVMLTTAIPGCSIAETGVDANTRQVLFDAGRDLATINSLPVAGFGWIVRTRGPVDHLRAKHGSVRAVVYDRLDSLDDHLTLMEGSVLDQSEVAAIRDRVGRLDCLFDETPGRLAHGDLDTTHIYQHDGEYAGIIDFGEIRGADRWYDVAHFRVHDGERLPARVLPWLLEGYRTVVELPADIEGRLELLSLINAVRALARDLGTRSQTGSYYQRFLTERIKSDIHAPR